MAKFKKTIIKEGKYRQYNPETGKIDRITTVSADDIKEYAKSAQKMQQKGIRIPAPWKHDINVNSFIESTSGGILEDSSKNAGFWEDLKQTVTEDGKLAIEGFVDVPGDPDDPNTPAGKVGTTVRDTSVYIKKNHQVTDGDDVIDHAIMHIALVTHPIENNQENFELVEGSEVLAMSQYESTDDPNEFNDNNASGISELVAALKDCCKLFLPEGTTSGNLVNNLLIAVKQYQLLNAPDVDKTKDRDILKVEPLIMNQAQIDALIKTNAVNPETGKPFTVEDFKAAKPQTDVKSELIMSAIQNEMQSDRRKAYRSRIDKLVNSGRTPKAYAESNLYPKADAYELELKDGKVAASMIDELIMSLEQLPEPVKKIEEQFMSQGVDDLTADDEKAMDETADYMSSLV